MATTPKIRKPYDPSIKVGKDTGPSSVVQQNAKAETDINTIMKKYVKRGLVDHLNVQPKAYMDVSTATDFHSAMTLVTEAQQQFEALPADVRKRYGNDPAAFLEALERPEDREFLISEGLLEKPPAPVVPDGPQTDLPENDPPAEDPPA